MQKIEIWKKNLKTKTNNKKLDPLKNSQKKHFFINFKTITNTLGNLNQKLTPSHCNKSYVNKKANPPSFNQKKDTKSTQFLDLPIRF